METVLPHHGYSTTTTTTTTPYSSTSMSDENLYMNGGLIHTQNLQDYGGRPDHPNASPFHQQQQQQQQQQG